PYISLIVEKNGCYSKPDSSRFVVLEGINVGVNQDVGCDILNASFSSGSTINNVDYLWEFGDGKTKTESNPSNLYMQPGFYDVKFTITSQFDQKCKASYLFEDMIKVYPKPVATFTGQQDLCYDDSLKVQYIRAKDSTFYYWYINDNMVSSGYDLEEITVPLDQPFTYVKLIVNEYRCTSDPYPKRFKRRPNVDFTLDVTEGCEPLQVEATGVTDDEDIVYIWLKNRQQIQRGNDFYTYILDEPAKYDLGFIVNSTQTGCYDTIQKEDVVWVHPNPIAKFTVDQTVVYNDNSPISFNNLSVNGSDYFWDFGDGNYSEEENPQNIYEKIGFYNPQLITTNLFGCLDSASAEIQVLPFAIFAPNAFRPDSDIEKNRFFMPAGDGIEPDKFNMKIYDRWGQLVFESFHLSEKWDGNALNGKPAQMGNYIWIASYYDILGSKHEMKGQVLLIR
ncbi:MAG: gliding motility-associated C-terminal domain-containing protein, partial [Prolixibacteraceae bacterium]|nr:gliding motility-associated C-terminal domain-containing protein [Prolixibacteraceae bacterium]